MMTVWIELRTFLITDLVGQLIRHLPEKGSKANSTNAVYIKCTILQAVDQRNV